MSTRWPSHVLVSELILTGIVAGLTSEEVTALRRAERKVTKATKKLEREAEKLVAASAAQSLKNGSAPSTPSIGPALSTVDEVPTESLAEPSATPATPAPAAPTPTLDPASEEPPPAWQLEAEHLQLQPEEAFFLHFALGCLSIRRHDPLALASEPATSAPLSILSAFELFLLDGHAWPLLPSPTTDLALSLSGVDPRLSRFDSPFLVSYASYHHFRSMGWVVRSGVKFCTEWVLYGPGGPVGGHAE